jgi:hypothetical protein
MPEENSTFQWSRILWILGWPATWLVLFIYLQFIGNPEWFFANFVQGIILPWNVAMLLIFGFQIAGSILLVKAADPKDLFVKLTGVFLWGVFGLACVTEYYVAVPGYEVPVLNEPIGRWVMYALVLWQVVGIFVLFKAQKFWAWLAAVICFSLPFAVLARIGPYMFLRNRYSEDKFIEVMARPGFGDLWKIDVINITAFVILACVTFPGIWTKLFRSARKPPLAS